MLGAYISFFESDGKDVFCFCKMNIYVFLGELSCGVVLTNVLSIYELFIEIIFYEFEVIGVVL